MVRPEKPKTMPDPLTTEQRSWLMSRIRSEDTKPEWVLRCALHRLGFRFRLRDKRLPGRPDLVFPKHGAVVFVHGCFWHRHGKCREASLPKTNTAFWQGKFERNVARDLRNRAELRKLGWRVRIVWECELLQHTVATVTRTARWLREEEDPKPTRRGSVRYDESSLDRRALLAVAEEKVEYRLSKGRAKPE